MLRNTHLWYNVAFVVFGISEILEAFDFLNNARWPPFVDKSVLTILLLSPLFLASGAAFLSSFGQSTKLCLWVLAIWWPSYMAVAHLVTVRDLATYTNTGSLRYQIGFLLSTAAICVLVHSMFKTTRVRWSRRIVRPMAAMSIVFVPWFGGGLFSNELALSLIYAIAFACVLGYEFTNRTLSIC